MFRENQKGWPNLCPVAEIMRLTLYRDNCSEMLSMLEAAGVPLVLFSAGIGDLIEMVFHQHLNKLPKNIHLISNMMIFNSDDVVVGFRDPLIHTFNKNSSVIQGERAFFHELRGRSNVLLLGDSLGDLHMDVGVENETDIIKIGFLNFGDERLVKKFMEGYDIVLKEDSTMNVPLNIVNAVLSGHSSLSSDIL